MSAMLMRNYQKLIKIKKGPKVRDLLITVLCKSCIIHSHESEPNTTETGGKKKHAALSWLYVQTHAACTFSLGIGVYLSAHSVGGLHLTATVQAQSSEIRWLAEAPTSWSAAHEQVRHRTAGLDYSISRGASNPVLVVHPAPCADLLPNGQMPMTHFLVTFPRVSFASAAACFTQRLPKEKRKKRGGHHISVRLMASLCRAFSLHESPLGFTSGAFLLKWVCHYAKVK